MPADVLAAMLRSDATAPRITQYDDTDSPTKGERLEFSAKVLANWVSKAANLLQDEFDVSVGTSVRLALPAHWRTAYWALAVWSVGATVVLGPPGSGPGPVPDPDDLTLTVTDDPDLAGAADPAVLVTLAGLARRATVEVSPGVVDEAKELATFADAFTAWDEASPSDTALVSATGSTAYADLVGHHAEGRFHLLDPDAESFLRTCLSVWAAGGSLVLTRGRPSAATLAQRLASEHCMP